MHQRGLPKTLRWLFCLISIGCLVAAGIYLGSAVAEDGDAPRLLRALMFFLLGTFFLVMYGENGGDSGDGDATSSSVDSTKGEA